MSASAALHPKGPRLASRAAGALHWAEAYLGSSVGQKILVAITGLSLAGFAVAHMIGNLKMFNGPDAINHYAYFLKHDLGALIWIFRAALLGAFLLHIYIALRLKLRAVAARPVAYAVQRSVQAAPASKTMFLTGLVIGAFIILHLAHFTFGAVHSVATPDGRGTTNYLDLKYRMPDGREVHNVYAMVISGFTTEWISIIYLIAQILLFIHLSHGIQSAMTTLGLVGRRFAFAARLLGYSIAGVILIGNVAIVVAVWAGYVK